MDPQTVPQPQTQTPSAPTPPSQPVSTQDEAVPSGQWPGAFKVFTPSKQAVMFNIGPLVGLLAISILFGLVGGLLSPTSTPNLDGTVTSSGTPLGGFLSFVVQIVSLLFGIALTYVMIAGVKREKMSVNESLKLAVHKFLPYLGQSIVLTVLFILSALPLLIPLFIVGPRLSLAPYFLLNENLGIMASIKASWEATRGHLGKIWGIIGVNILFVLICITIIGIPVALYLLIMYGASDIILYFWLKKQQPAQPLAAASPVSPVPPIQ